MQNRKIVTWSRTVSNRAQQSATLHTPHTGTHRHPPLLPFPSMIFYVYHYYNLQQYSSSAIMKVNCYTVVPQPNYFTTSSALGAANSPAAVAVWGSEMQPHFPGQSLGISLRWCLQYIRSKMITPLVNIEMHSLRWVQNVNNIEHNCRYHIPLLFGGRDASTTAVI